MQSSRIVLLFACLLAGGTVTHAENNVIDCSKDSLADAVSKVKDKDLTIQFTGSCAGPIVVRADGLALEGIGAASIDGGGQDAITVAGAGGVTLANFEVQNGLNGIAGLNGAHLTLTNVSSHDNLLFGITLQTSSSATLTNVSTTHNGVFGLDVETGSAVTVTGTFSASNNAVFGINVNGSSITFAQATVAANGNALGIQIATNANAFINDSATAITVNNNLSTGLTVVSGAHLVSFGGTINAAGNPIAGVSVNSKGGLDLDAGSTLTTSNNGTGLLVQEGSVMTVFNNPQFSGKPGFSTVDANHNAGDGIRVLAGSTLTLSNQAKIATTSNTRNGLVADNGVGVTLVNSTATGNGVKDLQLTFGARADVTTSSFGAYTCDATVLVRGTSGIVCPH